MVFLIVFRTDFEHYTCLENICEIHQSCTIQQEPVSCCLQCSSHTYALSGAQPQLVPVSCHMYWVSQRLCSVVCTAQAGAMPYRMHCTVRHLCAVACNVQAGARVLSCALCKLAPVSCLVHSRSRHLCPLGCIAPSDFCALLDVLFKQ